MRRGRPWSPERRSTGAGVIYPEWDYRIGAYRAHGAVVRPGTAPRRCRGLGRPRHGPPRDPRAPDSPSLRRPPAPPRATEPPDGWNGARPLGLRDGLRRLAGGAVRGGPASTRRTGPARRDLAIALLIDTSESTDGWVDGSLRIVDVEKEALVVLIEALDALGDLYAVLAFSGHGPADVRLLTVKAFEEPVSTAVRRRVAALEPDGYTRTGAAIRHASTLLGAQRTRYRLLLMLSDGKPNDIDEYEGRYGIEDTRQAVAEARLQGIVPFCLTVDREAPAYLPSIFGPRGYTLLRRPELLPAALVDAVRRLVFR